MNIICGVRKRLMAMLKEAKVLHLATLIPSNTGRQSHLIFLSYCKTN
jgi:hypothetical protein